MENRGEGENWRGLEPEDDVLTTCKAINTHASQRYLQTAEDPRYCSWCFEQILKDWECFHFQMQCMLSILVEIIFYCAWLIIMVWVNKPKSKETTGKYFALRHHRSIEECTRENSESVKQYTKIVLASLRSSLEVARYDCLPQNVFLNVSTTSDKREN